MKQYKIIVFGLIGVSLGFLLYQYMFSEYGYGMMNHHYGYYDEKISNQVFVEIVKLLVPLIIIFTCIILVKKNESQRNKLVKILNYRLASGEINIHEYTQLKNTIEEHK